MFTGSLRWLAYGALFGLAFCAMVAFGTRADAATGPVVSTRCGSAGALVVTVRTARPVKVTFTEVEPNNVTSVRVHGRKTFRTHADLWVVSWKGRPVPRDPFRNVCR